MTVVHIRTQPHEDAETQGEYPVKTEAGGSQGTVKAEGNTCQKLGSGPEGFSTWVSQGA